MGLIVSTYLAVKALLDADEALQVRDSAQLDAEGQLVREQYVILYPTGPDDLEDARFTKEQDLDSDAVFTFELKAVSITSVGCGWVADHILAALVRQRPIIEGRRPDPIEYLQMTDVTPDFTARPPMYSCDIQVQLTSRRG